MKTLVQTLILLLISLALDSNNLTGQWSGAINVQSTSLRLVFTVAKTDTLYKATIDSPDQNVSGISVTAIHFNYPIVKFEISTLGVLYEGTLDGNRITGKWMQSGQSFPLILLRSGN